MPLLLTTGQTSATVLYTVADSPIGPLLATAADDGDAITGLWFDRPPAPGWRRDDDALGALRNQLDAYFAGTLQRFDLPLAAPGTPWQRAVWDALMDVPYGETMSYGELAARLGKPTACRAVGAANGRNPISVIVPCHRLIGSDGTLTGYGGGLERKRWLLDHERSA
jgi:methylated-DNA-[protein]-cysteine S-methyltransferase